MTSSFDTKHAFRALPLLFSFIAFILAMLALFAGNKPGVLERYDIITVDTSRLGNNLGNKAKRDSLMPVRTSIDPASPNISPFPLPSLEEKGGSQSLSDNDNDMDQSEENVSAGSFYALYALTICEGWLTPKNGRKLAQCYPYLSSSDEIATIPALLSAPSSGASLTPATSRPAHAPRDGRAALTEAGLSYKLEAALDGLDTLFRTVGVLLSLGVAFTALSLLAGLPALAVSSETYWHTELAYDWAVWTNLTFAASAVMFLALAALVAAAGAKDAEVRINGLGEEFGVTAVVGVDWIALSWAVVGLMAVVLVYWSVRGRCLRSAKKKGEKRRKQAPQDEEAGRGKMQNDTVSLEKAPMTYGHDREAPGWREKREETWKKKGRGQRRSRDQESERYITPPLTPEPSPPPRKRSGRAGDWPIKR